MEKAARNQMDQNFPWNQYQKQTKVCQGDLRIENWDLSKSRVQCHPNSGELLKSDWLSRTMKNWYVFMIRKFLSINVFNNQLNVQYFFYHYLK
jgi:hypothetical protein